MLDHGRYIHRWEGWPRMAAVTQYLIRPYIDTSLELSRGLQQLGHFWHSWAVPAALVYRLK